MNLFIIIPVAILFGSIVAMYSLKQANAPEKEKAKKNILKDKKTKSNIGINRFKEFVYKTFIEDYKGLKDYNNYKMSKPEYIMYVLFAVVGIVIVTYIFYRSYLLTGIFLPLSFFYPVFKKKDLIYKQKQELNLQFREALYIISSSLTAGKSVEMAFRTSVRDLSILYIDKETPIIKELEYINHQMDLNGTIEEGLVNFARRAHLEDVTNFVDVFIACKRRGGNLVEIIKNTSRNIAEKIQIKQEIDTLITEKKFEQKVLFGMPVFLIWMLDSSSPEFMEPVFTEVLGRVGMTIAVVLFITAYIISSKIIRIEV